MSLQDAHDNHVHEKWNNEWGWKYASASMKWYGWGSPVGLSIFFLTVAVCAAIVRYVFFLH